MLHPAAATHRPRGGRQLGKRRRSDRSPWPSSAALAALGALLLLAACGPGGGTPAPAGAGRPAAPTSLPAEPDRVAAAAPTRPPPLARVRITDAQITSAAGSYIAAEKGYFREEGIEVEFVPTGADQVPVVVADQADVAGAPINAFLFNAFARGIPLRVVADHGANLPGASAGGMVIRKDLVDGGDYQGPASVRGWRIASATQGSITDIAIDRWVQSGGLQRSDVEQVYLSFPDTAAAFANKGIEAAYYQEPFTTVAVDRGLIVRGPIAYEIYPYQQIGVLLFGERLLADRALSQRHVRAYVRGVRDYVKAMIDREPAAFDEIVPILIEHTAVKDRALFDKAVPSGLKADPVPNVQSMTDDQEWFVAHGFQPQRVNVQDMVELSFVQQAIRELGTAQR
jgi:ABC-type nitrate/sulfonate/bicarbonate transport system substrate-binding protein